MPPISLRTAPVAARISLRDSSAASASLATIAGKCSASCMGVAPSICLRHGCRISMQPTLTFHFLSSMPARTMGVTRAAIPCPRGVAPAMMAEAVRTASGPSLLLSKRAMRCCSLGNAKGVASARAWSMATALALASAASLPLAAKAASTSANVASSALASIFTSTLAAAFALAEAFLASAFWLSAALSASRLACSSAALMPSIAFKYLSSCCSFFRAVSSSFFFFLLASFLTSSARSSIFTS
mmetsp:Transcript_71207/g.161774  ORF Transcript_71207/g.161774 Transcript_71207/m.161774 type:complete len:243 (+) Transcript_71207:466-1194(+)